MLKKVFAADPPRINNPALTWTANPSQPPEHFFASFISGVVGLLLTVAAIWAFIQLILGGIQWISSGGDKGAVEAARDKIIQAIIGLFIVFAAWAIFLLLLQFFGVSTGAGGVLDLKIPHLF